MQRMQLPLPEQRCAWVGTLGALLLIDEAHEEQWLAQLDAGLQALTGRRAGPLQREAWRDTLHVLRAGLPQLFARCSKSADWPAIFEYELPREGGRRVDMVVLADGCVAVLEFKQKPTPHAADIDQTAAYARDLAAYHAASHNRSVVGLLVLTRGQAIHEVRGDVAMYSPETLPAALITLPHGEPLSADEWLQAEYAPLPSIVAAARRIFAHEPLPTIRRAQSAGIPTILAYLDQIVQQARAGSERHIVLITGAPGAGKTLVGLQFVYGQAGEGPRPQAVMLSGNAHLVTVLQYALKNRVFVQPIRNFFLQYGVRRKTTPPEQIFVFDEAQRAWDPERMTEKYDVDITSQALILEIAERVPDWSVMVALIGEGQEIHVGEEGGMPQWRAALEATSQPWRVHCPPQVAVALALSTSPAVHPFLNLNTSLRTHLAEDVQRWVGHLLDGELVGAATIAVRLRAQGYTSYLTRDLDAAKEYCRTRYAENIDKRYGLLASSKANNLPRFGVDNSFQATQRLKVGPWYLDPPDSPDSCCALQTVATEFVCQGLELDLPIVCWGSDLVWDDARWQSRSTGRSKARDPHRLRVNSYRVLLTRGRDGALIYVPPDKCMDETYRALCTAGFELL